MNEIKSVMIGRKNMRFSSPYEALKFLKGCILTEGSIIYYDNGKLREIKISNSDLLSIKYIIDTLGLLDIKYHITIDNRFDDKHRRLCYYVRIYGKYGLPY